jgi:DNA-3-methyladenine glycosylase I
MAAAAGAGVMARSVRRCGWVNAADPLYRAYHDEEWGVPERDPRTLWEKLILDGFQAGLAWITILRKRETLREAFDGFDPARIARYDERKIARLLQNPGIIRSRAKIQAAIAGARVFEDMQRRGEDFADYVWSFVGGQPMQNRWTHFREAPAQTPESVALAKDLKARGFKFCGPVIVYAFMQAVGMVNDHEIACHRYKPVKALAKGR